MGAQERNRCTWNFGCESEQQSCAGSIEDWNWTKWSECSEGFLSRQKCSTQGDICLFEDVECEGSEESKWTEWGECKSGFQEREKCQDGVCMLDSRMCKGDTWTDWGACGPDGRQSRTIRKSDVTVTEDKRCSNSNFFWWEEDEEEISLDSSCLLDSRMCNGLDYEEISPDYEEISLDYDHSYWSSDE